MEPGSRHLKSALLSRVPRVSHGFGTLLEEVPASLLAGWQAGKPVWRQTHGVASCEVRSAGQECGEVDALYSRAPGQPVGVVTADCVPILLARKDGGAVAAIHAGWRGTRARIIRALWDRLTGEGEHVSDWVAAIGPAIGPCCYEVSPELADDFVSAFSRDYPPELIRPKERILDLPAINAEELRSCGIQEVDLIRACTRCSNGPDGLPLFHSYRREGGGTRELSIISRAP